MRISGVYFFHGGVDLPRSRARADVNTSGTQFAYDSSAYGARRALCRMRSPFVILATRLVDLMAKGIIACQRCSLQALTTRHFFQIRLGEVAARFWCRFL
jgi:hypothetical protein